MYLPPLKDTVPPETRDTVARFCSDYENAWPVEYQGGVIILKKAYDPMDFRKLA